MPGEKSDSHLHRMRKTYPKLIGFSKLFLNPFKMVFPISYPVKQLWAKTIESFVAFCRMPSLCLKTITTITFEGLQWPSLPMRLQHLSQGLSLRHRWCRAHLCGSLHVVATEGAGRIDVVHAEADGINQVWGASRTETVDTRNFSQSACSRLEWLVINKEKLSDDST